MRKQGRPRTFMLTAKEQQALKLAEQHCPDGPTRMRYQAGCLTRQLSRWCAAFRREGVVGLVDRRVGGNRAKHSTDQIEQVQNVMHRYTPDQRFGVGHPVGGSFWTLADVRRLVKDMCEVVFNSDTSYRTLMHTCGMSFHVMFI